jgi:tetratricopeptide (TPR) repeat protein
MKKVFFVAILLLAGTTVFAQKGKVSSAENYKDSGKLDKALEAIEETVDPNNDKAEKTLDWPRTWEVRGEIYQAIFASKDENYKKLSDNPLEEAYKSYMKALSLDDKDRYANGIKIKLTFLIQDLTKAAVNAFQAEKYDDATKYFENILDIEKTDLFKKDTPVDTVIIYNTGLAATNAKQYKKAIDYFKECIKYDYNGGASYGQIISAYEAMGDTTAAVNSMKEGFEAYPESQNILVSLINYYMSKNKSEDAISYLDKAIEKDPKNPTFYFAKGAALDKLGRSDEALKAYQQATEVNPKFADAYYNMGVVYFNRGVKQLEVAAKVPPTEQDKYEAEKGKADVQFKKAIPYMEKASELNPKDRFILEHLKNLYYRLKMMDKFKEVSAKLDSLK